MVRENKVLPFYFLITNNYFSNTNKCVHLQAEEMEVFTIKELPILCSLFLFVCFKSKKWEFILFPQPSFLE